MSDHKRRLALQDDIDAAIKVVAKRLIADVLDPVAIGDLWENYPELDERDFRAVCRLAVNWAGPMEPTRAEYQSAYDFLTSICGDPS